MKRERKKLLLLFFFFLVLIIPNAIHVHGCDSRKNSIFVGNHRIAVFVQALAFSVCANSKPAPQMKMCDTSLCYLWECQDLKCKILIKNKKKKPRIKTEQATEESADEGEEDYDDLEDEEDDEDHQTKTKFWSPRKAGPKKEVSEDFQVSVKERFLTGKW